MPDPVLRFSGNILYDLSFPWFCPHGNQTGKPGFPVKSPRRCLSLPAGRQAGKQGYTSLPDKWQAGLSGGFQNSY